MYCLHGISTDNTEPESSPEEISDKPQIRNVKLKEKFGCLCIWSTQKFRCNDRQRTLLAEFIKWNTDGKVERYILLMLNLRKLTAAL